MIQKIIKGVMTDPLMVTSNAWDRFLSFWLSQKHNVEVLGKITVMGHPLIDIRNGSSLSLGHGVTLNSRNRGYHINMHSPVKLFADKPGAAIRIGDNTRIHGTCVHAHELIEIGSNCLIAANCQIFDAHGHDLSFSEVQNRIHTKGESSPIKIEDDVWIGANSVILPGVTIGRGSIIAANSVVNKYVPPMVIAGGNPVRVIKDHRMMDHLKSC